MRSYVEEYEWMLFKSFEPYRNYRTDFNFFSDLD